MDIDVVIPFVDPSDDTWEEAYEDEFGEPSPIKFRANKDLFKYCLRSVAENMPWVRTLHLVVSSKSQVPEWVDQTAVHVVEHKDFIPKKLLPTFNECTIEIHEHLIPGLSETFVYGNDDYYVLKPMAETDFFTEDGTPKITWMKGFHADNRTPWYSIATSEFYEFVEEDAQDIFVPAHVFQPQTKQSWLDAWEDHGDELTASITKKADRKNKNQYFAQYYLLSKGQSEEGDIDSNLFAFNLGSMILFLHDLEHNADRQMTCLNDTTNEDPIKPEDPLYQSVVAALDAKFPNKCKYEK